MSKQNVPKRSRQYEQLDRQRSQKSSAEPDRRTCLWWLTGSVVLIGTSALVYQTLNTDRRKPLSGPESNKELEQIKKIANLLRDQLQNFNQKKPHSFAEAITACQSINPDLTVHKTFPTWSFIDQNTTVIDMLNEGISLEKGWVFKQLENNPGKLYRVDTQNVQLFHGSGHEARIYQMLDAFPQRGAAHLKTAIVSPSECRKQGQEAWLWYLQVIPNQPQNQFTAEAKQNSAKKLVSITDFEHTHRLYTEYEEANHCLDMQRSLDYFPTWPAATRYTSEASSKLFVPELRNRFLNEGYSLIQPIRDGNYSIATSKVPIEFSGQLKARIQVMKDLLIRQDKESLEKAYAFFLHSLDHSYRLLELYEQGKFEWNRIPYQGAAHLLFREMLTGPIDQLDDKLIEYCYNNGNHPALGALHYLETLTEKTLADPSLPVRKQ